MTGQCVPLEKWEMKGLWPELRQGLQPYMERHTCSVGMGTCGELSVWWAVAGGGGGKGEHGGSVFCVSKTDSG